MLEYFSDEPDTHEEGGAGVLGECAQGEVEVENDLREEGGQYESVPVAVDGIQCESEVVVLGDGIECEGDCEIRKQGTQSDIGVVLSDGLQCQVEGEVEIREDGVQCEAKCEVEIREDGVQCEAEVEVELREVGVHYEVEVEAQLREEGVQYQGVRQTKIEEDGDVHNWTEFGPDDSMDERIDNLDVSIDCDIDDELSNKEWSGNVKVKFESVSRG